MSRVGGARGAPGWAGATAEPGPPPAAIFMA
jgi:hypothetical protein